MRRPMRWMVGVDATSYSHGAVAFATWAAGRAPENVFVATHVVEHYSAELWATVDPHQRPLPHYAEEALQPLQEQPAFARVGSIPASTAEDGLEASATEHRSEAFIIGRRKPTQGRSLVRLGRVARRMLRTLALPTIVVPPDLTAEQFSDGPVVLATDCTDASVGAAGFAAQISRDFGLDLLVTTVAAVPDEVTRFMPGERFDALRDRSVQGSFRELKAWTAEHAPQDVRTSVVEGSVGPQLLDVARVAGASMIVTGSRRLGLADRLYISSVGSELAASAAVPVAVVPPPA